MDLGAPTVTWHAWPPGTATAGALGVQKTASGGGGVPGWLSGLPDFRVQLGADRTPAVNPDGA